MKNLKKPKEFIIVALLLHLFLGCIILSDYFNLTDIEKIKLFLNLLVTLTGTISAIFVVFSYIQTNSAFVLSQKPLLLIQIENYHIDKNDKKEPMTIINYQNITNNSFEDLTFEILVKTDNRVADISELFREEMHMPGYDKRQRTFDPVKVIKNKGIDIIQTSFQGTSIILEIYYSYTFLDTKEEILAQKYKWNNLRKEWSIY